MRSIYLDNAASTPMLPDLFEEMKPWLVAQYGNPSSTHAHGRKLRDTIESARRQIATCLGAQPGEIFITSGGTEADNTAITGAVHGLGCKHIISTQIEHHAVTHTIEHLVETGAVSASWLSLDEEGNIDLSELEDLLAQNPQSLVSLMHANNETGNIYDLQAIGDLCEAHGALFHSDTVQAMGNIRYELSKLPVHFIAASAHKFYGPKGIGFLYIKKGHRIPPLILGGGQERNMRAGTENVAFIVGMAYALNYCYSNLESKNAHLWDLKNYMREQLLQHFPDVRFNGARDMKNSLPTILNTSLPCGEQDGMLLFNLDLKGISASGGSACNSGALMGSHVLRTIGVKEEDLLNAVRFSFGIQNTREEIDYVIEQMHKIVHSLRV